MKLKSQSEIVRIVKELKKQGKKIVTRNGSFDLLHLGHVLSLEESKKQGDILIVLLNSDRSVRAYKGPNHPLFSQKVRAQMLSALESVDYVVIFDEPRPLKILAKIKPDIHCRGPEWRDSLSNTNAVVKKYGGKIHVLKEIPGFSTSDLIKKISKGSLSPEKIGIFLPRFFSQKLLEKIAREFGLNLSKSFLVGTAKDVKIAREANLKIIEPKR